MPPAAFATSPSALPVSPRRFSRCVNRPFVIRCATPAAPSETLSVSSENLTAGQSHFLHVNDFSSSVLRDLLNSAADVKERLRDRNYRPLYGHAIALLFSKPSARTRVSFETGIYYLGGHALVLGSEVGVGTREAPRDVARVLSRMTDLIMARLGPHEHLTELARYSSVPVVNGLTDFNHPCQIVADALTIIETRSNGQLDGVNITYVGDGNNIVNSWLELAQKLPINLTICTPPGYAPDKELVKTTTDKAISQIALSNDPRQAVHGAEFIYTDVWASMGQKEQAEKRVRDFKGFCVDEQLMKCTGRNDTKFMHCLPAERGRECTDAVMESTSSVVWKQAENRMHAQNALLMYCLGLL